jgi:diguanylate cyclase (GGDEF)-like protein/PAS domain S-box-containing protein
LAIGTDQPGIPMACRWSAPPSREAAEPSLGRFWKHVKALIKLDSPDAAGKLTPLAGIRWLWQSGSRNAAGAAPWPGCTAMEIDALVAAVESSAGLVNCPALLDAVLDTMDEHAIVAVTDRGGRILYANRKFCELSRYERHELVGQDHRILNSGHHPHGFFKEMWATIGRGRTWRGTFCNRARDGSLYWVQSTIVPIPGDDGRPSLYVAMRTDVSDLKAAERSARDSEASFRSLFDSVQETVYVQADDGSFLAVNAGAERMYGLPREWFVGKTPVDVAAPGCNDLQAMGAIHARALTGEPQCFEFWGKRGDGSIFPKEVHLTRGVWFGRPVIFALAQDISARKRDEAGLRLAASVFAHANEAIMVTNRDGVVLEVNDAFCRITGYRREDVVGHRSTLLRSDRQGREYFAVLQQTLDQTGRWTGEIWGRRRDGRVFPARQTASAVRDDSGQVMHYVSLFYDITELKEQERQLQHRALHDALTGLPNRALLADRLRQAMSHSGRAGKLLALAYLDLDGFKEVNDLHGHEAGDLVLVELAQRLQCSLRDGDTLARLGGDEFVAVMPDLDNQSQSLPMLDRLIDVVSRPIDVAGLHLQVSASIGATFFPQADAVLEPDQLVRQADQAMYKAKQAGKGRYHLFDAERDRALRGRYGLIEQLRRALELDEFHLHYQPKVNLRSGEVIGVEALLRWMVPGQAPRLPEEFLPLLQGHALELALGQRVLEMAAAQAQEWRRTGLQLAVSVNVGAVQLDQTDFIESLAALLARHPDLAPGDLELEVLETSALADLGRTAALIHDCNRIGVHFALDDFGTGYSSLSYLKQLPVRQLKIDRSFVHELLEDPDNLAILDSVQGLARAFSRQVIAEGVESLAQGEMLLRMGCEFAQGFAIARPMPAADVPAWISSWRPHPRLQACRPLRREAIPALALLIGHRAWLKALVAAAPGAATMDAEGVHAHCGQWLAAQAADRQLAPGLAQVLATHADIHRQGEALLASARRGDHAQATAALAAVEAQSETLLQAIEALLDDPAYARNEAM